jgi:hypothetical protein
MVMAAHLPATLWLLEPVFGHATSEQEDAAVLECASYARILFTYCVAHGRQGERHRRAYQFCSVLERNISLLRFWPAIMPLP